MTLEAAEPVPFWDAIDRLCQAGGLQREYPPAGDNFFPFKPPFDLTLVPGKARPPASDTGALRVELLRVRHRRERDYGNTRIRILAFPATDRPRSGTRRPAPPCVRPIAAELLVSAEPRLRIFGVGELEKAEAVDDRGRSLLRTPTDEERAAATDAVADEPAHRPETSPRPALRLGLAYLDEDVARFGPPVVPVAPRPADCTAPRRHPPGRRGPAPRPAGRRAEGRAGKEFSAGSTRITVHEIKAESGREPTVDFTLETAHVGDEETIMVCDSKGARLAVNRPIDLMELRLEVLDSRGESLFWQFTRAPTQRTQGRMAIVIHDRNSKRERPDDLRLRYWEMIGAATDLPFVFKDVPTP